MAFFFIAQSWFTITLTGDSYDEGVSISIAMA